MVITPPGPSPSASYPTYILRECVRGDGLALLNLSLAPASDHATQQIIGILFHLLVWEKEAFLPMYLNRHLGPVVRTSRDLGPH
jgi:hypothetical protein